MKRYLLLVLALGLRIAFSQCLPPTVSGGGITICQGNSTQLCVSGSYVSYKWNTGDTTQCINVTAGDYQVTVTDTNSCTAVSAKNKVSVYPSAGPMIIIQKDTLASFGAVSYQWYFNDSIIEGATGTTYIVHKTGYYSVLTIDANGCRARTGKVYIIATSIMEYGLENTGLKLFPNPSTGILNLEINGAKPQEIIVYNIEGQKISEQAFTPQLSIANLANGVYLLEIKEGSTLARTRFVKM